MTEKRAQIIGRFIPPDGEARRSALEFKELEGRVTVLDAYIQIHAQIGEYLPLHDAVITGRINSYAPGSRKALSGSTENFPVDDEEVYWDDVVAWLAVEYPRIKFDLPQVQKQTDCVADESIDFAMLATRAQLIAAFGAFTGMDDSWFTNLKDTPKLLAARRVEGTGGKNSTEPLFCPYMVMCWQIDPKKRKGRNLTPDTGWQLLEGNFLKVFNQYSIGDTRAN